ncbi:hypothetical protein HJC23_005013 [Cyclotella cryptica]|uniref:Uncharacterized protein n=1 Tax=Cyclotella cryptica TaxID=29204 RepID=A0ABD3QKX0_9STRA
MKSYHAHFDCFSGAAGDMMLAACLDAADSLPNDRLPLSLEDSLATNDGVPATTNTTASERLLTRITRDLENGMPELKGEFALSTKRVWRSMGRIAARKVDVKSVYDHEAAPVPADSVADAGGVPDHDYHHEHDHHHEHRHHHEHEHRHEHEHEHKHDHAHNHNHRTSSENSTHLDESHHHEHSHTNIGESDLAKEDPHDHDHNHSHSHSHNSKLRNLSQITKMLQAAHPSHIPPIVASLAIAAFTELAHAEMHTHGASSLDSVHFHEVGAVDSIVDTVGTTLALYHLGVDLGDDSKDGAGLAKRCAVSCSRLPIGEGTVWTDHGLLPVPAPATMRLMVGMPTCPGPRGVTGELVTPTAAALLRVLTGVAPSSVGKKESSYWKAKDLAGRPPWFTPRAIGIGAGSKDFERHANILRLVLGDNTPDQTGGKSEVVLDSKTDGMGNEHEMHETSDELNGNVGENWNTNVLTHVEANIDDATPELLAHAIDLLLQNGAIDAWINPIVMKKGRPAHTLNCTFPSQSCPTSSIIEDDIDSTTENRLLNIIFKHTTTLGIRIQRNILRASLMRRFVEVQLPYTDNSLDGKVNVKISFLKDGEVTSVKAEFDQCKVVSVESGVPLKVVSAAAERMAWDLL